MSTLTDRQIELLSAFADGEVDAAERAEAERLIAANAEAATFYRGLTSTTSMLKNLDRVQAPATLRHIMRNRMVTSREIPFYQRLRLMVEQRRLRMSQLAYILSFIVIIGMLYFVSFTMMQRTEPEMHFVAEEFPPTDEEIVEAVRIARAEPQPASPQYLLPAGDKFETPPVESPFPLYDGPAPEPPELYAAVAPDDSAAPARVDTARPAPAAKTESFAAAETRAREPEARPLAEESAQPTAGGRADNRLADRAKPAETDTAAPVFRTQWGTVYPINSAAAPGSDANPLRADVSFSVGASELATRIPPDLRGSIRLSGAFTVAASGAITWYEIEGPATARAVVEAFAAHLRSTSQEPHVLNGRPVAIAYRFTATIATGK